METKRKVQSLGLLRAVAVLMVVLCHFGKTLTKDNIFGHLFNLFYEYGKYGVQIFFVVSGFIIPLSMDKAKYKIKYYFNFLLKRVLRLHPPYLLALLITLILAILASHFKHVPFSETPASITKSLFYLVAPAENPVFWSLKIEAEYYIFIGLYFIILSRFTKLTIYISIPLLIFISQTVLIHYIQLFNFIIFFLIGTMGYLIYTKNNSKVLEYVALICLISSSFYFYEIGAAIASLFTVAVILFYRGGVPKAFDFYGEISYSVYLIHFPIGIKLLNLATRHFNTNLYWILFLIANIVISALAFIFWKFVEKPSADLSNKIKYGEKEPKPLPV